MTRRGARVVAGATVFAASAIAWAAVTPGSVVFEPPVAVVTLGSNQPGSGSSVLRNTSMTETAQIASIDAGPGCGSISVSPNGAISLPPQQTQAMMITCPANPSYEIKRCQLTAVEAGDLPVASLTVLCITQGTPNLSANMSAINFGDVTVGDQSSAVQLVVMSVSPFNKLSIQIGDQDGNFEINAPCLQSGAGCDTPVTMPAKNSETIFVRCTPKRSGSLTAPLYIVGNGGQRLATPVMLGCNGVSGPEAAISVADVVALSQRVVDGPASTMVEVKNIGMAALAITSITKSGHADWTISHPDCMPGCMLAAQERFYITTTFDPASIDSNLDASIQITSNDPDTMTKNVVLEGTGLGATLALAGAGDPPSIDLGTTPVGTPTSAMFQVRNDPGNEPLAVTLAASRPEIFSVSPMNPTLAGGGAEPITITCTPEMPAAVTGTITISAPMALDPTPISVMVQCTGTSGSLRAVPGSVALDEVRVGGSPRVISIQLQTTGPDLTITSPPELEDDGIVGMTVGEPSSLELTTIAPATFELTVMPVMDGDLMNRITVAAGADTIEIPVTGRAVTPEIMTPAEVHLGSFCVGEDTTRTPIELVASGTASIRMLAKPVMAGSPSPFQLTYTAPVESAYAPHYDLVAKSRAMVEAQPMRQMVTGIERDDLIWTTDMPGAAMSLTRLTAEFVADGGAIAPMLAGFGQVQVGQAARMTKTITIENCGTELLDLSPAVIEPTGEFHDASAQALPDRLAPNQTVTRSIGFTPRRAGLRDASLVVGTAKGPLVVRLTGEGIEDLVDDAKPTSFYACSCRGSGSPAHGAPLVGVLLLVLRRRARAR